jgi:dienelactone hydrolase
MSVALVIVQFEEDRMMKLKNPHMFSRRRFLALASSAGMVRANEQITYPVISEQACPPERVMPVAKDGHQGLGFIRKPPGVGPFPVFMIIHPGATTWPEDQLKTFSLTTPTPSRFLAAGYVMAAVTYRSRDVNPQSTKASLEDCVAAVDYLKRLQFVDSKSIIVYGCSGGGDLTLEVAAATEVCAIVTEEPASMAFTGVFGSALPKNFKFFTPADVAFIHEDPKRYYRPENQKLTRAKIDRIRCPILIIQGDIQPVNRFNAQVLIPELRNAEKKLEVITYPGEPHCFCFSGGDLVDGRNGLWRRNPPAPWTPHEAAALKAFNDIDSFCKRHVLTKPKVIDSSLVKLAALTSE